MQDLLGLQQQAAALGQAVQAAVDPLGDRGEVVGVRQGIELVFVPVEDRRMGGEALRHQVGLRHAVHPAPLGEGPVVGLAGELHQTPAAEAIAVPRGLIAVIAVPNCVKYNTRSDQTSLAHQV
jgi:hypothetical protein